MFEYKKQVSITLFNSHDEAKRFFERSFWLFMFKKAKLLYFYLVLYTHFSAYEFWSIQKFPDDYYYYQVDYWFGMTEYFFFRFSECLNPIFYNLGSAKMRKYLKRFVNGHLLCCYKFAKPIKMSTSESGIWLEAKALQSNMK